MINDPIKWLLASVGFIRQGEIPTTPAGQETLAAGLEECVGEIEGLRAALEYYTTPWFGPFGNPARAALSLQRTEHDK